MLSITLNTDDLWKDKSLQWNKAIADRQCKQTHFTLSGSTAQAGKDALSQPGRGSCVSQGWHRWATHHQTRQVRNPQLRLPQSFRARDYRNHAPSYPEQSLISSNSHESSYQHIIASHQELNVERTRDGKGICNLFCSSFYLQKNSMCVVIIYEIKSYKIAPHQ